MGIGHLPYLALYRFDHGGMTVSEAGYGCAATAIEIVFAVRINDIRPFSTHSPRWQVMQVSVNRETHAGVFPFSQKAITNTH
jgi:hypothetical protein